MQRSAVVVVAGELIAARPIEQVQSRIVGRALGIECIGPGVGRGPSENDLGCGSGGAAADVLAGAGDRAAAGNRGAGGRTKDLGIAGSQAEVVGGTVAVEAIDDVIAVVIGAVDACKGLGEQSGDTDVQHEIAALGAGAINDDEQLLPGYAAVGHDRVSCGTAVVIATQRRAKTIGVEQIEHRVEGRALGIEYVETVGGHLPGKSPLRRAAAATLLRAYVRNFAIEWWYSLAMVLLYPFGLLPSARARYFEGGGPPIVLAHGYLMNRSCMFAVYWRLRRLGYRNIYAVNLLPVFGSIEDIGTKLVPKLREISLLGGGQPVYCVCHSMGGVVLRWCLHAEPTLAIAKIVTVASPHNGTRLAVFGFGRNAVDLRTDSALLTGLEPTSKTPLVSIYSELDNMVIPSRSAAFGDTQVQVNEYSHISLLFGARAFERIATELPRPAAMERTSGAPSVNEAAGER